MKEFSNPRAEQTPAHSHRPLLPTTQYQEPESIISDQRETIQLPVSLTPCPSLSPLPSTPGSLALSSIDTGWGSIAGTGPRVISFQASTQIVTNDNSNPSQNECTLTGLRPNPKAQNAIEAVGSKTPLLITSTSASARVNFNVALKVSALKPTDATAVVKQTEEGKEKKVKERKEERKEERKKRKMIRRCKKIFMCVPWPCSLARSQYRDSDYDVEWRLTPVFTFISSSRTPGSISPSILTPKSLRKISHLSPDALKKGRPKTHPFTRAYRKIRCPYLQGKSAPSSLPVFTSPSSSPTSSKARYLRYVGLAPSRSKVDVQARFCLSHHGVTTAYEAEPLYKLGNSRSSVIASTDRIHCDALRPGSDNHAIALPESRASDSTVNPGDPISMQRPVNQNHPCDIIRNIHRRFVSMPHRRFTYPMTSKPGCCHTSMAEHKWLGRLKKMQRPPQRDLESSTLDPLCNKNMSAQVPDLTVDTPRNDFVHGTLPTLKDQVQEPKDDQVVVRKRFPLFEARKISGALDIWSAIDAHYAKAKSENNRGDQIKAKRPDRRLTPSLYHTLPSHGDESARVAEEERTYASPGSGSARPCDYLPPELLKSTPSTRPERIFAQAEVEAEASTSHKSEICQVERKESVVPSLQSENRVSGDVISVPEHPMQGKSRFVPGSRSRCDDISSRQCRSQDASGTNPGPRSRSGVNEPIIKSCKHCSRKFVVTPTMFDIPQEPQQCPCQGYPSEAENTQKRGNQGQENNAADKKSKWKAAALDRIRQWKVGPTGIRRKLLNEQMERSWRKMERLVDKHEASPTGDDKERQRKEARHSESMKKLNEKMDRIMWGLTHLHGQHCANEHYL
ncbi:hypothetical protein EDD21DRAFT_368745 [Dissophora ornata]|nr:hypothetical protein EDD21DRAFT_368745 [Dissophora ornata]